MFRITKIMFLVFCIMNSLPVALMSQSIEQVLEPMTLGIAITNSDFTNKKEDVNLERDNYRRDARSLTILSFIVPGATTILFATFPFVTFPVFINVLNGITTAVIGGALYCWNKALQLSQEEEIALDDIPFTMAQATKYILLGIAESIVAVYFAVVALKWMLIPAVPILGTYPTILLSVGLGLWISYKLVEAAAYNFKKFLNGFSSKPKGSLKERKQQARVRGALV
jgi:hypothetical protein